MAEPWIIAVIEANIPNVLANKHWYGPKNRVTREEAVMWYVRTLGVGDNLDEINERSDFKDVELISDEAQNSIWLAEQLGLIQGDEFNNFKPQDFLDRQGAAALTYRVYHNAEMYKEKSFKLLDFSHGKGSSEESEVDPTILPTNSPDPVPPAPTDPPDPVPPAPTDPPDSVPPAPTDPPDSVPPVPTYPPDPVPPVPTDPPDPVPPAPTDPPDPAPTAPTDPPDPVPPAPTDPPDSVPPAPTDPPDSVPPVPTYPPDPVPPVPTDPPDPVPPAPTDPPDPAPTDPGVIPVTVTFDTYTIPAATDSYGSNWKVNFVLLDAKNQEISDDLLPSDLQVIFTDDHQILGSNGDISNFYNIPSSGTLVQGWIRVVSMQKGIDFSQSFQLVVDPSSIGQQFMGVSILLEDTGSQATTIAEMDEIRNMFSSIDPSLKVTWALDNRFVFGESQRPQLQHLLSYVDTYGDEIGIVAGYPNNNYSLSQWADEMNSWIYMYRYNAFNHLHMGGTNGDPSVWNSIPEAYRPKSLSTYAVNPEQAMWLKQNFEIDSFMGWAATQYNVDQLSAEGSPLMPYWSNINNPMVPAQNAGDNSGLIFMNAITIDPIGSRYTTGSSRWTIHPADPYVDEMSAYPQIRTTSNYISNPYRNQNTINYLSLVVSANWIMRTPNLKTNLSTYIDQFPREAVTNVVGVRQLSEFFKQRSGGMNDNIQFTLMFRGTGYTTTLGGNVSPASLRYLWMETKSERIILSKEDQETEWNIIDFTDYSLTPVPVLPYTQNGAADDISYITGRNYKLAPNAPLTQSEVDRVKQRLRSILFNESVSY
ncbi:S-layer homology domain-containing protein [Bacillales bacterium AN1005]